MECEHGEWSVENGRDSEVERGLERGVENGE